MGRGSLSRTFAAVSLFLAACGGGGDAPEPIDGSPASPSTETTTPSPTPAPAEAVTFRTSDGVRIAGRLFGDGPIGVVLGHSIDGDGTEWWNVAEVIEEAGHAAVAIDFRGYCPGDDAGCSEDGSTGEAWRDLLAGATFLRDRGVRDVVLIGASMGGTASVLAAANARPGVAGVITLSSPTACCGMEVDRSIVEAIGAPMLFVAGRFDGEAPRSARAFARWAGPAGETLILGTGEHGTDLVGLATPLVERRTNESILAFLERLEA
ncbi:MAG: alpha/beta fold hydrolase [Actinomycetota bacterium]